MLPVSKFNVFQQCTLNPQSQNKTKLFLNMIFAKLIYKNCNWSKYNNSYWFAHYWTHNYVESNIQNILTNSCEPWINEKKHRWQPNYPDWQFNSQFGRFKLKNQIDIHNMTLNSQYYRFSLLLEYISVQNNYSIQTSVVTSLLLLCCYMCTG